jgi:hypothetical protein
MMNAYPITSFPDKAVYQYEVFAGSVIANTTLNLSLLLGTLEKRVSKTHYPQVEQITSFPDKAVYQYEVSIFHSCSISLFAHQLPDQCTSTSLPEVL